MIQKAKEVFISYSTKDQDVAFSLLEILENYGLDCWIAPRNIPQGAQWAEEIDKAIQNAKVFVVIVSSHSMESKQVPKEVALAVTACESIFPFRIDDTGLQGTFRYYLSDYQFTDATSNTRQKMNEMAAVICSSLGKPVPETLQAVPNAEEKKQPGAGPSVDKKTDPLKKTTEKTRPEKESTGGTSAGSKPMKPILIGIIAAVVVVGVIIGVVLSGKGKKENSAAEAASAVTTEAAQTAVEMENITAKETNVPVEAGVEEASASTEESSTQEAAAAEGASASAEENSTQEAAAEEASASTEENSSQEAAVETAASSADASDESDSAAEKSDTSFSEEKNTALESCSSGVWKKVAYEDRGADTDIDTRDLYVFENNKVYASVDDWLSTGNSLTFDMLLDSPDKYQLSADYYFDTEFDGSISDKTSGLMPTIAPFVPSSFYRDELPDENPTSYTYEDCYPDMYLFIHLTGTLQETPVKKSDVDTWLVYQKSYPILNSKVLPALSGDWEDDMGNTWTFIMKEDDLTFAMTDSAGTVYTGASYTVTAAEPEKVNFFERIRFRFEEYETDRYAVLSFDGQTLSLLDESWNEYVLRKK